VKSLSWISGAHCLTSEPAKEKKRRFERKGYSAHVLSSRPSCTHSMCLKTSRREFVASKTREPCKKESESRELCKAKSYNAIKSEHETDDLVFSVMRSKCRELLEVVDGRSGVVLFKRQTRL
jgi:hypothetical protein